MSDAYRALTHDEIGQMSYAINKLAHWAKWVSIAKKVYGDDIKQVDLDMNGDSDDEGGTYWYVTNVSVIRTNGETEYNVSADSEMFRGFLAAGDIYEDGRPYTEDEIEELRDAWESNWLRFMGDEGWRYFQGDLEIERGIEKDDDTRLDVNNPPQLPWPALYVKVLDDHAIGVAA